MRRTAALGLLLLALASCGKPAPSRVARGDYQEFFLWAGVKPSAEMERARALYMLAGELRAGGPVRFTPLRQVPRLAVPEVWLTVRAERLDWDEPAYDAVLRELSRWRAAGNAVRGLQVDFDTGTRGLAGYAAFLAGLRKRLPASYRLSITGLMDWSANGDPAALASLSGVVDEVVVQTYQGRATIPGYERWLTRLDRLPLRHKVALVEGGEWLPPPELARDPNMAGYVVFAVNP